MKEIKKYSNKPYHPDNIDAILFLGFGYNVLSFTKDFSDAKRNYLSLRSFNSDQVSKIILQNQEIFIEWNDKIRNYLSHSQKQEPDTFKKNETKLIESIKKYLDLYETEIRKIFLSWNKNAVFDKISQILSDLRIKIETNQNTAFDNQLLILLSMSFFLYKHELKLLLHNLDYYNFFNENNSSENVQEIFNLLNKEIVEKESLKHSEIDKIYFDQLEIWNLSSKINLANEKNDNSNNKFSIKEIFHILNLLLDGKVEYSSSKRNFFEKYSLETNEKILDYDKLNPETIYFIKFGQNNQFKLFFYKKNKEISENWIKRLEEFYKDKTDSKVLSSPLFKDYKVNKIDKVKWFTLAFNQDNIFDFLNKALKSKGETEFEKIKNQLNLKADKRTGETLNNFKKIIVKKEEKFSSREPVSFRNFNTEKNHLENENFIKFLLKLVISKVIQNVKTKENADQLKLVFDRFYWSFYEKWQTETIKTSSIFIKSLQQALKEENLIWSSTENQAYINSFDDKDYKTIYQELINERTIRKQELLKQDKVILTSLSSNFNYYAYQKASKNLDNQEILNLILNKISNQKNTEIEYRQEQKQLILKNQIFIKDIDLPIHINEIGMITQILLNQENNFPKDWKYHFNWKNWITNNSIIFLDNYQKDSKEKVVKFENKVNVLSKFILELKEKRKSGNQQYEECANSVLHTRLLKTEADYNLYIKYIGKLKNNSRFKKFKPTKKF